LIVCMCVAAVLLCAVIAKCHLGTPPAAKDNFEDSPPQPNGVAAFGEEGDSEEGGLGQVLHVNGLGMYAEPLANAGVATVEDSFALSDDDLLGPAVGMKKAHLMKFRRAMSSSRRRSNIDLVEVQASPLHEGGGGTEYGGGGDGGKTDQDTPQDVENGAPSSIPTDEWPSHTSEADSEGRQSDKKPKRRLSAKFTSLFRKSRGSRDNRSLGSQG